MAEINPHLSAIVSEKVNTEIGDHDLEKKLSKKIDKKEGPQKKTILQRLLDGDQEAKVDLLRVDQDHHQLSKVIERKYQQAKEKDLAKQIEEKLFGSQTQKDQVQLSMVLQSDLNQVNIEATQKQKKKRNLDKDDQVAKKDEMENKESLTEKASTNANIQFQSKEQLKQVKKQQERKVDNQQKQQYEEEIKYDLKGFANAHLKSVLSDKTPIEQQKKQQIKDNLLKQGYSSKQISEMEYKVNNMVRQNLQSTLKKKVMNYLLYFTENQDVRGRYIQEYRNFVDYVRQQDKVGGFDFGNRGGGTIENLAIEETKLAREEIKGFIYDQSIANFVKYKLDGDYSNMMAKQELLEKLAKNASNTLDLSQIAKKMDLAIEHLGLFHFLPPAGLNTTMSFQEGEQQKKKDQEESSLYLSEEDKLEDKLRDLFMEKALNVDFKSQLFLLFKVRKLKNGLIKLGIFENDKIEKLQREGELLAKAKLFEKLKSACEEQATLEKLSGPAYDIIKSKKAYCIKTLKKLDERLNKEALNKMQDQANRELFPIIYEELKQLEIIPDNLKGVYITRKQKSLRETLERLKKESGILEEIKETPINKTITESV